jgi:hypothetical protein
MAPSRIEQLRSSPDIPTDNIHTMWLDLMTETLSSFLLHSLQDSKTGKRKMKAIDKEGAQLAIFTKSNAHSWSLSPDG